MKDLARIVALIWRAAPWAMTRGAVLTVVVLLAGAALLGLSGWFITATGLAGIAGIGIAFDVFRPSAGVRLLALGRAGARYAERLLTHDATLRALAALRVRLLDRLARAPVEEQRRLRGPAELNRITADVDALDGAVLRLALPVAAALVTHVLVFLLLLWLTAWPVAASLAAGYLGGGALVLLPLARRSFAPSREAETQRQALRREAIELFRHRAELALQGRLTAEAASVEARHDAVRAAQARLDRLDADAGFALSALVALIAAAVLLISGGLVASGSLAPAPAAIGVFVALALAETLLPLRRGLAEIGRMRDAATRVLGADRSTRPDRSPAVPAPDPDAPVLRLTDVAMIRTGRQRPLFSGLALDIAAGETVALTGASGLGKSTLLDAIAGLRPIASGAITLMGVPLTDWSEPALRAKLTLVPQRAALIAGTIRDNLALADPALSDGAAEAALAAVALTGPLAPRGGLDARLGEGGAGLSGGQARRLILARALLRRPALLLLDEPTEGLDRATALSVLKGIREFLPQAAILVAAHRAAEWDAADRLIDLEKYITDTSYD